MAATTPIEWTDATWSPITGCTLVSEGCRNCYAARVAATRLKNHPSRQGLARINAGGVAKFTGEVRFNGKWLDQPLRWKTPKRIFVCAHSDLFHEAVPDDWIDRVFAVMALAPHHTFQVLTKRPERMRAYLGGHWQHRLIPHMEALRPEPAALSTANGALRNVWLGVSAEDRSTYQARAHHLAACPAALRFLSAEPLLGDLGDIELGRAGAPEWIIAGGESGPGARPSHPDWFRNLRDQCDAARVPFFFKQWGAFREYDDGSPAITTVETDEPEAEEHAAMARNPAWLSFDGHCVRGIDDIPAGARYRLLEHVGKTAAGRLLDGVTHDGMPS